MLRLFVHQHLATGLMRNPCYADIRDSFFNPNIAQFSSKRGLFQMPAERLDRKVTVILATDVAAYSKHVEQDESLTIKTYSEHAGSKFEESEFQF